ncbi:MAG TPA: glutamyl-tRNA reductase [Planctomycetes bacterium]|nr:glutamyl-tRNA reductase [Planctomycetota bacterium]
MVIERLVVVGTSFRRIGFGRMGDFVLPPEAHDERRALQQTLGAEELLYVSTCNRVELYALLPASPTAERVEELRFAVSCFFAERGALVDSQAFFAKAGAEALTHLFRVASSLDSLVVGETEISGQLRRSRDLCRQIGVCGKTLHKLTEKAIGVSRRVRTETAVGDTHVSVATIALQKIRQHFGKQGPGVTALIGVGDMSRKVAQALQGTTGKCLVVNRTFEKAEAFCEKYGGTPTPLETFLDHPPGWLDLVFAATASDEAVLRREHIEPALAARRKAGVQRPLIVVDLGLPRDIHPEIDELEGVLVVAMEHLETLSAARQKRLEEEKRAAAEVVREEVERQLREDRFRSLAGESAEAMLSTRMAHLCDQDRDAILSFVTGLAGRMARQPVDLAG